MFVTVQLLEDTPAVSPLANEWKEDQVLLIMTKSVLCKCDNFVPVVVRGLWGDTSVSDSAENTKELAPSDRDATQASSDRLQDLPECQWNSRNFWWTQDQHHLVVTADPPETPRRHPLPSDTAKGKHNLFTHLPKDPNCEICKRTKITTADCRRNSKTTYSAQSSSVTSLQSTTRSFPKKENRGTIRGM